MKKLSNDFYTTKSEVEILYKKNLDLATESAIASKEKIAEMIQKTMESLKGETTLEGILRNLAVGMASVALTIFSPEVAIAFTVVAVVMLASTLVDTEKPYVGAVVGVVAGALGFLFVHHVGEAAVIGTWKVLGDFVKDVTNRAKEKAALRSGAAAAEGV